MSSSLIVYLKSKDCDIKYGSHEVCLLNLSTTPARDLYQILPQTITGNFIQENSEDKNDYKILSWNDLNQILQYYRDNIQSCIEKLSILNKELDNLEMRIVKIENVSIYEKISEEINDIKAEILYIQQEKDEYGNLFDRWNYCVKEIFLENLNYQEYEYIGDEQIPLEGKGKYELVYYLD